jgi:hypothetical protein
MPWIKEVLLACALVTRDDPPGGLFVVTPPNLGRMGD